MYDYLHHRIVLRRRHWLVPLCNMLRIKRRQQKIRKEP